MENGKRTAQPFARYGNIRRANISKFLAFVLLVADSSCLSFLKRFVVPSKARDLSALTFFSQPPLPWESVCILLSKHLS